MLLSIHFVKYNKIIHSLNITVTDYSKGSNDVYDEMLFETKAAFLSKLLG